MLMVKKGDVRMAYVAWGLLRAHRGGGGEAQYDINRSHVTRKHLHSATRVSTSIAVRATTNTFAPSARNSVAQARPMPLVPPVTTATFPTRFHLAAMLDFIYLLKIIFIEPASLCFSFISASIMQRSMH